MSEQTAIGAPQVQTRPYTKKPSHELLPLTQRETEARPFPISALGEKLAAAAEAIEETVQCPAAIAAQSVLATAALAVQSHYDAENPVNGQAPCSLFLFTVAESGERKSTCDTLATRAVEAVQSAAEEPYRKAFAQWLNACEAKEAARAKIKSVGRKGKLTWEDMAEELDKIGPNPEAPLTPKQVFSDGNTEGIFKFAESAQGSLQWNNSEAAQIVGGVGFIEENRVKTGAVLSRYWDGANQDHIRSGSGAKFIRGRRLTLHFMMQKGIAASFLSDPALRSQGFFARVLIAQPVSTMGQRKFRKRPDDFDARVAPYERCLAEMLNRPPRTGERLNELLPEVLPWSDDARLVWREFFDKIEGELGEGQELADHQGFGSKLAENVSRIATVLQGFNNERAQRVCVETMLSAIEIGEFYLSETLRLAEAAADSVELQLAEKVRDWLIDPARWSDRHISLPMLMRYGPSKARSKEAAEGALAVLQEHGWLSRQPETALIKGDRTDKAFEIRGRLS